MQKNVIFLPAVHEGGHTARAEHGLKRAANGLNRHTKICRTITVHSQAELGLGLFIIHIHIDQARVLTHFIQQNFTVTREVFIGVTTNHELNGVTAATAAR